MSMQLAPRLVSRLTWGETDLVEGTEAMLWPASSPDDAAGGPPEVPGWRAVLSWVRPQVIRLETAEPLPLPDLMLVGTLSVAGPAYFVARKSYQIGTTAACEPPTAVHIVERRDLFRVPVAANTSVALPGGTYPTATMDLSLGGARICLPQVLAVGTPVELQIELLRGQVAQLGAEARHCCPIAPLPAGGSSPRGRRADGARQPGPGHAQAPMSIVGFAFIGVPPEAERRLSDFLARHQRRLMPRVTRRLPMEYRPEERSFYYEAFATEISPGDMIFGARKPHLPGERVGVRVRLGRSDFEFAGRVVAYRASADDEGAVAHIVRVSFAETGDVLEAKFRKAVRDLAIDSVSRR